MNYTELLKSYPCMTLKREQEDSFELLINNNLVKIFLPVNCDFIIIEGNYSWTDDVNILCIENNLNMKQVLQHLYKKLGTDTNSDLYKLKLRKELLEFAQTSTSKMTSIKKTKQLFDKSTVSNIIITEYINNKNNFNLELKDNNIYDWILTFYITNEHLQNQEVIINISFHDMLYPNYPPMVQVIRPKLANNLGVKISNVKLVNLEYWNPTRDMKTIIDMLNLYLTKYAKLDINSNNYTELERNILRLSIMTDSIKNNELDELFTNIYSNNSNKSQKVNKSDKAYFAKGTGYGSSSSKYWDVESYVKSKEELNNQINIVLHDIELCILEQDTFDNNNLLVDFFNIKLDGITLLEINNNNNLYTGIFNILLKNNNLLMLVKNKLALLVNNLEMLLKLEEKLLDTSSSSLIKILQKLIDTHEKQEVKTINTNTNIYVNTMNKYKFDFVDIINTNFVFKNSNKNIQVSMSCQKRLIKEISTLQTMPIHENSSIFHRVDPSNMGIMRTLITGPQGTPYEGGCFIFDTLITNSYPDSPPSVLFVNTGGVRFNPNLYNEGKVCLSLLGTWSGTGGESWNQATSTLSQIYLSIQSLILVDDPYFNEPGYERDINTEKGKQASEEYNKNIRKYTIKHAMIDLLENPNRYPQFTELILEHFRLRKDNIIKTCSSWNSPDYQHLVDLLNKL